MPYSTSDEPPPASPEALERALATLSAAPAPDLPGALRDIAAAAARVLPRTTIAASLAKPPAGGSGSAGWRAELDPLSGLCEPRPLRSPTPPAATSGASVRLIALDVPGEPAPGRKGFSALEAPIRSDGGVIGAVRCERMAGGWSDLERAFVASLGDIGSLAAEREHRRRLEARLEALRDSEEEYRAIFDASNDAILLHDMETGAVVDVNRRACELHAATREELIRDGVRIVGAVPPYTAEHAMEYMRRAARGESLLFEWCTRHGTPDPAWGEVHLQPVTIRGVRRILAVVRDISERKAVERELQQANAELERRVEERTAALAVANETLASSERHFRRLIENSHDLVQVLDAEGRIAYTGPSSVHMLGYIPEQVVGGTAPEFIHPDDVEYVQRVVAEVLATPGVSSVSEFRVRHSNGSWRWMECLACTLSPTSAAEGLVVNARDVTDRKQAELAVRASEERFRALIENAHDVTCILTPGGRMEYLSPSATRVLGYAADELAGRDAFDFIHPEDAPHVLHELAGIAAAPATVAHAEYRFRHRDGSWRLLEVFARTLVRGTAEEGIVANIRDVTERRRTEEALRQATADAELARGEAEKANIAKSEFLSRMSHELRTPMNSILGFAQLLSELDQLSMADRNAVQHILTAGEHLLRLINEVLDISRIEAGRQELSLEPVRLGSVLQEALALVRPLAAARTVWMAEEMGAPGERFVRADRQRLVQVLLNLLSNAVKYNRQGGTVRVRSEIVEDGAGAAFVRVRVEDTGCGIAPGRRDELFVPFARLGAEQTDVEGTGLGLALSRRLMSAMGGSLALESSSPQGSTFRVDLQLATVPPPAAEQQSCSRTPSPRLRPDVRLVYVEDNLANLSLIEAVLAPYPGWTLIPALQGQLGVELAREHVPDLVLLDLHLPDIPGEEVLRRLRADARTAAVPIVVISADATPRSVERLVAAGADAYLSKPLNVKRFLETMGQFLAEPADRLPAGEARA